MIPANRDDFGWLVSSEAKSMLQHVQASFVERVNAVRIAKSLRKSTTPTRSALVMEQAQLRLRARRKFNNADSMFFTRRGLEQASGEHLAQYKARRFAGISMVADICCGIGGDLIALASRNRGSGSAMPELRTFGIDRDELTALFARKNLEANSLDSTIATVDQAEFANFDLSAFEGLHFDPDRRREERTVHGNRFSPSLRDIFSNVAEGRSIAVKVAPATPEEVYFPIGLQREWIGDNRECKQQVLWFGPAADKPGHRTATLIGNDGTIGQVSAHESSLDDTVEVFDSIRRFIYEPHSSVLAAKLTDFVARKYELKRFSLNIAFLTGDNAVDDPLLARFEVLEVLPLNLRRTIEVLESLRVGEIEVKKRGIETVTAEQFARIKLNGPNMATIILTRAGSKRVSVIAKRKTAN